MPDNFPWLSTSCVLSRKIQRSWKLPKPGPLLTPLTSVQDSNLNFKLNASHHTSNKEAKNRYKSVVYLSKYLTIKTSILNSMLQYSLISSSGRLKYKHPRIKTIWPSNIRHGRELISFKKFITVLNNKSISI